MTLIIAAVGKKSIWVSADRRLTKGATASMHQAKVVRDDATKLTVLDAPDGNALIGYAGLGATASETEPAEWHVNVLLGINARLEPSLALICQAMQRQFPKHYVGCHTLVVPAFIGLVPKLYRINFSFTRDGADPMQVIKREFNRPNSGTRCEVIGSGATDLPAIGVWEAADWERELGKLIAAHERNSLPARSVASYLAKLNDHVHHENATVGPDCIVAWRYPINGGGHMYFEGTKPSTRRTFSGLPTISRGMDMRALFQALLPAMTKNLARLQAGEPCDSHAQEIDEALARLPSQPNTTLK